MGSTRRRFCGVVALAASLGMLGCGDSGNTYVRTVNASNGLTNYTVQVGQTGIASSLPYGTEGVQQPGQYTTTDNSGNYRAIGAGASQNVIVYTKPGSTPLATETHSFLKNVYSTVVTLSPAPGISLLTLTDGDTAPASGDFKLRLVQSAATAGGGVDVYFTAQGAGIGGATPAVTNLQFTQVTQQYLQLPAGTVDVQITPTGNPSKIIYSGAFTPASGAVYTGYFLDPPAGSASSYSLLLVKDPVLTATTSSGK